MANQHPLVKAFLDQDSETFSYVVYEHSNGPALIIDPLVDFDYKSGRTMTYGAYKTLEVVQQQSLHVNWILETHAHADHLSAAPYLRDRLGAKIGIGEHINDVQAIFK